MHYLLFYEVDKDYVSKRAQFRNQHLEKAWQASQRGELVLGGALANPVDGAVLLFKGDSPEVAENFARADPYVTSGAVKRWYVREWTTVAGVEAATPIRPDLATNASPRQEAHSGHEGTPQRAILRMWRGRSKPEIADQYLRHVTKSVFPKLGKIPGNRGAFLLQHPLEGEIEFVVLTLWDSMKSVQEFAGKDAEKAVVEPEARSVLSSFDDFVKHYDVLYETQNN